jgi:hypothetical protein
MSFLKRILARRREKEADLAAIAKAREEEMRAGDDLQKSMTDVVGEAFDTFPPGT